MRFFESKIVFVAVLVILAISLYFYISNKYNTPSIAKNPDEYSSNYDANYNLTIKGADTLNGFKVAIVDTPATQEKGLMNIKHMNVENGLLFQFDEDQIQTFWMKNTYIPLDMIFIDKDKKIINIAKNAEPLLETPTYSSVSNAKYVLEINAYLCDRLNIQVGDIVDWTNGK